MKRRHSNVGKSTGQFTFEQKPTSRIGKIARLTPPPGWCLPPHTSAELPKAEHDVAELVQNLLSGEGSGPWPLPSTAGRAYICVGRRAVRKVWKVLPASLGAE